MKTKKITLLLTCFVLFSSTLMAQNAGRLFVGGTFQLNLSNEKSVIGNISTVQDKSTTFGIIPSIHYFLNDNWAIGAGIGYIYNKTRAANYTDDKELYNRINSFVFKPSVYYFLKLSDKFYYTPQLYLGIQSGKFTSDLNDKSTYEAPYSQLEVGLSVLNFEFRPVNNIGLSVSCGNLAYQFKRVKLDADEDGAKTEKSNDFTFDLQNSFSFAFRYYFK